MVKTLVRPSVAVLQHFSSTRVLQFNKCYVGNAIHPRLHCVVFSPVHPQRCIGLRASPVPLIALIPAQTVSGVYLKRILVRAVVHPVH